MHQRYAGHKRLCRLGELDRPAAEQDFASIELIDPAEDLAQRALACAVFPAQRVTTALCDLERHVVERDDARKPLGDASKRNAAQ
jgi:hypothetical protein